MRLARRRLELQRQQQLKHHVPERVFARGIARGAGAIQGLGGELFDQTGLALLDHGLGARLLAHVGEAQALGVTQQRGAVQTLHQRHGVGRSRIAMAIQRQQTAHGLRRDRVVQARSPAFGATVAVFAVGVGDRQPRPVIGEGGRRQALAYAFAVLQLGGQFQFGTELCELGRQRALQRADGVGGRDGRVAVELDEIERDDAPARPLVPARARTQGEVAVGEQHPEHDRPYRVVDVELRGRIGADQQAREA